MQGRSPTCYSPRSPLEHPGKGLSVRLACVKHAASVRPEPESNSPNKNPQATAQAEFESEKSETKQDTKNWHQKTSTPKREKEADKKQQTKTTKHTIEFSNNTPARPRNQPAAKSRGLVVRTIRNPPKWGFPLGAAALFGPGPCRSDSDKLREGKLGVKWAGGACLSVQLPPCARRRASTPTSHPTRSTPAIFRLPRRRTNQRPWRKSDGCGAHSSLSIRTLLT